MQEALKFSASRVSSYANDQRDHAKFYLSSPNSAHARKGDPVKSVNSGQLPSTKLGLYKALQPLLKLASPSRPDGSVFSIIYLFIALS